MVEKDFARIHRRYLSSDKPGLSAQSGFLTID
jgi:hypothetical protein